LPKIIAAYNLQYFTELQPSLFKKCKGDSRFRGKDRQYETLLNGASPNLFGSVISIRVWLRLSPFEVILGYRLGMTWDVKAIPAFAGMTCKASAARMSILILIAEPQLSCHEVE